MEEGMGQAHMKQEGETISGRYVIEKCLGAGGMGAVYLAQDNVLEGNRVALKVLHSELTRDNDLAKRFLREVQLMHKVNHPNVVRTYDVGREEDLIYFTMEYLPGASLDRLINKDTTLPLETIVNVAEQVCLALQAIHSAEIIHRDLKPANILVLEGNIVKLTDFGVARPKGSNLTQHNEIIGSVEYMAPEVWLGKGMTPALDFYSLGIILYQLATGSVPFASEEPASLMWMHVKKPPTPPKELRSDIPNWLNNLILKLLAKAPTERPQSGNEIITYFNNHARRPRPGDSGTRMSATGSFTAVGSGSYPSSSTGSFPTTTSGSFPTTSSRRSSSRKYSTKRKKGIKDHALLISIGVGIIVTSLTLMPHIQSLLQDLFPYG